VAVLADGTKQLLALEMRGKSHKAWKGFSTTWSGASCVRRSRASSTATPACVGQWNWSFPHRRCSAAWCTAQSLPRVRAAYGAAHSFPVNKVFANDVLACPVCSGRMKLIAYIGNASVARRILEHLGLPRTGPPLAKARLPEIEGYDPAPDYEQADPSWDE